MHLWHSCRLDFILTNNFNAQGLNLRGAASISLARHFYMQVKSIQNLYYINDRSIEW